MAIPLAPLNKGASGYAWVASDLEAVSTNPEDYLPKEETPALDLQPLDTRTPLPDHEKNKRAFYSAMLEGDPSTFKENYIATEADLTVSNDSPLYDKHVKSWEAEQTDNIEGDVNNILLDPSVPTAQKMQVLKQFQNGEFISKDLEDKYIQQVASEDIHETVADKKSQDIMLPTILETVKKHRTVEDIKAEALAVESGSGWGDVIAGLARDFIIPGSALAESFWIQQGLSEALGEKFSERVGSNFRSFFMQGSNNAEIGRLLDSTIEPERKLEFIRAIIEYNKQFPGNSYNKWSQYVDKIDQGEMGPIETAIEDFFGWADFVGAGKLITSPIRTFRYLTTLEMGGKSHSLFKGFGLDTIGKTPNIADIKAREAAEAKQNEVASNPPTGVDIPQPEQTSAIATPVGAPPQEVVPPSQLIGIGVQPAVKETSPIGITKAASPTKARELATQAILDPAVARASGAEPGEIVGSFSLEKLDDDFIKNNPDISKDLEKWDREFNNLYDEVALDPYLVDTVERTVEKERIYRTFQETQGAYYQASNSTLNESLGAIEGRARYGRNADFGFNSAEEAILAENHLKENFVSTDTSKYTTNIVQENGQWYVDMNWKREYDPFTARTMDVEASFLGFNVSSFARTHVAKYIMPPTTRLPEWFTKGGYLNSVTALRIEEQFNRLLKDIQDTKFKAELDETLIAISENQKYLTEGDIAAKFPHLDQAGRTELMKKQYQWKRLSEYMWNVTNRVERSRLEAENMQGIYKADGTHLGNGRATDQVPTSVDEVWNFDMGVGVRRPTDLQGMQFVKLDSPMRVGNKVFNYAMVGGGTKLDILPSAVVPKIEGYVPRMNVESWYVKSHPKSIVEDGRTVSDINTLREKHTRTIGAAKNKKEAEQLAKKLQEEMGDDFVVSHVRERSDVGDAILTDFKVYKEKTDYGKTRGDRLPTIDGFARLEHPFVAASKRIRTLSRLDAWRGYDEVAKKNFMNRFSAFLPRGEFPNTIHDLKLPNNATEDMVRSFNEAQRIFEQYSNSKYKLNQSDVVWKTVGHKIADKIEGWQNNLPAEKVREIANKGDLFRKGLKSLGTNLFLNLGPAAQWIVQTQVILPFAMVERGFRNSMHMLPALMISTLGKASHGKPYKKLIDEAAATLSMEKRAEFEAIADAIYKVGIPQGVDLNMMLHGGLDEISQPLVKGLGQKSVDAIGQVISKPGQIGKTIGYTPAQLMADMAGFLFAKARWERMNPGKNWNTPTHIRQIAGDAWDIMGSMASRAGSMPFQDGYLGILFQFQAILAKNMFTLFSSKSLKKAPGEIVNPKVKLAAANMAIFGVYGVPASTLIYKVWEQFFGDEVDPETLATYQKYRGGLIDLVTNATIDTFFAEEGDRPMDLAIAKRIGPMPETVPYVDLGWELAGFMLGNKTDNPRFPFVNAVGSIYDAVRDAHNIVAATPELNTVDAVMVWASELAEATSTFNNYGKAAAIAELGDKKNKFGSNLGLELTFKHAVAQVLGITSQQEVAHYEMMTSMKDREQYINDRVAKLSQDMEKLKDKLGTPDFEEYVRRAKVLNAATREEDREEIFKRFTQRDRHEWLTKRQSMMKYFIEHHKGQNDYNLKQMEASFANGTPEEQEFLKMINRNLSGTTEQE